MSVFGKNSEKVSRLLFTFFALFLLVELLARFSHTSDRLIVAAIVMGFSLVTLFRTFWGLWLFVAGVPLLNGLFMGKEVNAISLAFIGVCLAWILRSVVIQKKEIQPHTLSGFFIELLIAVLFLNVCVVFSRIIEWPLPSRSWLSWFFSFPFVDQKNLLWQINAAMTLLKGLFLFRMLEIELQDSLSWRRFTKTIYVQTIVIVIFSVYQYFTLLLKKETYITLSSPFEDTHSYGSYAVLLLIVFLYMWLHPEKTRNDSGCANNSGTDNDRTDSSNLLKHCLGTRIGNGLLVLFCALLCVYSFSRMTWLAGCLFIFVLFLTSIKKKYIIVLSCVVVLCGIGVGSLFGPQFRQSDNRSLRRVGTFLDIKNINQDRNISYRRELWTRSVAMGLDFPLTGAGIGNFYRNNVQYERRFLRKNYSENAHNYYLQLFSEIGLPGLSLFLMSIASLYWCRFFFLKKEDGSGKGISGNPYLYGIGAYLMTMLTAHPLLVLSQQFVFWSVFAISVKGKCGFQKISLDTTFQRSLLTRIGYCLLALYLLGLGVNGVQHQPWTIPQEYGLYSPENWKGGPMQWMAEKAQMYFPEKTGKITLKVVAQPFNSSRPDGLTVVVSFNDTVVDRVHFLEGGTEERSYDVSSMANGKIKVNLQASRVFSPREIGLNDDPRMLGVALKIDGTPL